MVNGEWRVAEGIGKKNDCQFSIFILESPITNRPSHSPAAMFLRGSASLCWIVRFGNSEIPQCGVAVNSLMTPAKANNPLCSPHGGDADGAGERQSRQLLAAGEFAHPHPGGRRNLLPRDA